MNSASKKTGKLFYDKLSFVYIQMPNFTKTEDQLETHLDKWLYLLKNLHKLNEIPLKLQERLFKKVFNLAEVAKYTKAEYQQYIDSLKYYLDLKNTIESSKIFGFEEGEAKGRMEGRLEGRMEGRMEEKEARIKLALKNGKLTKAEIAEMFEVSIEYVEKLANKKKR